MRLALLTLIAVTTFAWPLGADAYRVIDGDTVKLDSGEVCRPSGVDAPEARQPLAQAARDALVELMAHDPEVAVRGRDRYDRSLCVLTLADGDTINRDLVRRGLAEVYRGRTPDPERVALEREAQSSGLAIWERACYESPAAYRQRRASRAVGPCESK